MTGRYQCPLCEWEGEAEDTDSIRDYADRVEPGDLAPVGECPDCGALIECTDDEVPDHAIEAMATIMRRRGWLLVQRPDPTRVPNEEEFDAAWHLLAGIDGKPLTPDTVRDALTAARLVRDAALTEHQLRFYHDILCSAIEAGAVAYWAEGRRVERNEHGEYVGAELRPHENPETGWRRVCPSILHEAVRKLQGPMDEQPFNSSDLSAVLLGAALLDGGALDADAVDCLVQFALYGKIVYG